MFLEALILRWAGGWDEEERKSKDHKDKLWNLGFSLSILFILFFALSA